MWRWSRSWKKKPVLKSLPQQFKVVLLIRSIERGCKQCIFDWQTFQSLKSHLNIFLILSFNKNCTNFCGFLLSKNKSQNVFEPQNHYVMSNIGPFWILKLFTNEKLLPDDKCCNTTINQIKLNSTTLSTWSHISSGV